MIDSLVIVAVRRSSRDFLSRLLIFVNALADTNIANHVDVDSMPSNLRAVKENPYAKTVNRARTLVRRLEALLQSIFDHGGSFLLAAQEADSSILNNVIPFMEQVMESVLLLEQLYEIGQEQSTMHSARDQGYDYRASIDQRMSRINYISGLDGIDGIEALANSLEQELAIPDLIDPEDEDVIDLGAALTQNGRLPNSAASHIAVRQLDLSPNSSEDLARNEMSGKRRPERVEAPEEPEEPEDNVVTAELPPEADLDEEIGVGIDIGII